MTEEELKYYTALQPLFREKMGKWRDRDGYMIQGEDIVFYEPPYADDDWWNDTIYIRLPLPIDPVNPGRGLWGMVKQWRDEPCLRRVEGGSYSMQAHARMFYADTPTLALLKALAHQEGVEVK